MNEVQEAMAEAFVEMLEAFGVPVTVNGESHEATMSQNDVVIEDAEGGFMKKQIVFGAGALAAWTAVENAGGGGECEDGGGDLEG